MKKQIILIITLLTFGLSFSQNVFPTAAGTNIGIGTSAPSTRLQLTSATAGTSGFRLTNLLSTTAVTTGLLGKALSVNKTGDVVLVPVSNTDLYTADGALVSTRTVTMGGNNLTLNPTNNSSFSVSGTTGNVGIGNVSPTAKLEVTSGIVGTSGVKFTNLLSTSAPVIGNGKVLSVDTTGNVILVTTPFISTLYNDDGLLDDNRTVDMNGNNLTFKSSSGNSNFFIDGITGNVGIGTINSTEKLEVKGALKANRGIFESNQINGQTYASDAIKNDESLVLSVGSVIGTGDGYKNTRMFNFFDFPGTVAGSNNNSIAYFGIEDRNDQGRFRMIATTGGETKMIMLNKSQQDLMKIYEDGNDKVTMTLPKIDSYLGIGTSSFLDATDSKTYRLSVKGRIRAEEVKVYNTWADYVFNKDYKLPTLKEVEGYIKENRHLPNVPSAKEVTEKGLELGEMARIQQEKIEELTLYLIQQNKEIQELKEQVIVLINKK
ncbi:hypothetical protein [Flavobacterium sp.]|uniref:hypothetical protein n=1 Tax=Flavobacterium sp. TaxID=239 RepID=UPI0038FCFAD9